jgi:23S rRNA (adenine2503-C2)-methyltransferase
MSNISRETQVKLSEKYFISRPEISKDLTSFDGTRKWLLRLADGKEIEMVYIPETDRATLCISSQVGCTLTCKFCHTGTQLLVRNLAAFEIVGQLMLARDLLGDWNNSKGDQNRNITSIVFMGMGEPLYNYDNVKKAVEILNDADGINISRRKITVSTSGVVPELIKFSDEVKANLAISLHGTNDEIRSKIMPLNKKYPLAKLMEACKYYLHKNPNQRITFEYVMLKDVNDSDADAVNLVHLITKHKLTALVNLIPFNKWTGAIYECSSRNRIMAFSNIIKEAGLSAPIRKTRGEDVMAACGQLKSDSEREKKIKPN